MEICRILVQKKTEICGPIGRVCNRDQQCALVKLSAFGLRRQPLEKHSVALPD